MGRPGPLQWMGSLLSGKNMLIMNIAEYGDVWLLPLADWQILACQPGWVGQPRRSC